MKFSQFIDKNMKAIFLEKPFSKCGGDNIPRPISKTRKMNMSLDQ